MPSDRRRVSKGFLNALGTYEGEAAVQATMARRLSALLQGTAPANLDRVLEIGCGTGLLTQAIVSSQPVGTLFLNDLVAECLAPLRNRLAVPVCTLSGDIERLEPLPGDLDLVMSNACLQWLDDLPALLQRLHDRLRPGGLLLFSTFGPGNLGEVRALTGTGLAYQPLDVLLAIVGEAFEVLHGSEERVVLRFASPRHALRHLRATGVNGLPGNRLGPSALRGFLRAYAAHFAAPDGSVPLTYHPQFCLARRRAPS